MIVSLKPEFLPATMPLVPLFKEACNESEFSFYSLVPLLHCHDSVSHTTVFSFISLFTTASAVLLLK